MGVVDPHFDFIDAQTAANFLGLTVAETILIPALHFQPICGRLMTTRYNLERLDAKLKALWWERVENGYYERFGPPEKDAI